MTIDIMLPHYGDVLLMKATVRSILAQDDPDWRLTVIDDGYPDASIPSWFASLEDDRVRYQRNEQNLGINRNFQKCVDLVEHDLSVIIGSDDLMLPNYVRTIRETHKMYPQAAIIQPGVEVIDEHGKTSMPLVDKVKRRIYAPKGNGRRLLGGQLLAHSLLRGNWLYFPSLAWRSDALKKTGFREGLTVVQDLALVMDLIQAGEQMVVDDTVCFQYRRHSASVSSLGALQGSRFIEERNYFLDVADRLREQGWHRAARAARLHLSSRLHALTLLPNAVRKKQSAGIQNLSRHIFGVSSRVSK